MVGTSLSLRTHTAWAALMALAVLMHASTAIAAPYTWTGAVDDSWGVHGNWAEPGAPDGGYLSQDVVTIDNGDTVKFHEGSVTIKSLSIGENTTSSLSIRPNKRLSIDYGSLQTGTGGTLSIDGGELSVFSGVVTGSGTILNAGPSYGGGEMRMRFQSDYAGGTLITEGYFTVDQGSKISGGQIQNSGRMYLGTDSDMTGGTVTNEEHFFVLGSSLGNSGRIVGGTVVNTGSTSTDRSIVFLRYGGQLAGGTVLNETRLDNLVVDNEGAISGGRVVNNGQVHFSSFGNMTGGVIENNERIYFNASHTNFGIFSGGKIINNQGATISINRPHIDLTIGTDIANYGSIRSIHSQGDLTFTGDISGKGITGVHATSFTFDGSLRPGFSPGLMTFNSEIYLGANNVLYAEIGGHIRGTEYDAIDAYSVTLGGLLDITLLDLNNGFSPMAGDTFDLIIANQIVGAFSSFNFASLLNGLYFTTNLIVNEFGDDIFQLVVMQGEVSEGVPAPGAVFLLVIGLAGCAHLRRRSG